MLFLSFFQFRQKRVVIKGNFLPFTFALCVFFIDFSKLLLVRSFFKINSFLLVGQLDINILDFLFQFFDLSLLLFDSPFLVT